MCVLNIDDGSPILSTEYCSGIVFDNNVVDYDDDHDDSNYDYDDDHDDYDEDNEATYVEHRILFRYILVRPPRRPCTGWAKMVNG